MFGTGIARGHHAPGEGHGFLPAQKRGSPEIEELDCAFRIDQDIGWFQIPMHDQVAMGVVYRAANLEKDSEPGIDVQPFLVAVPIDRLAIDVLGDKKRIPSR